MTSITALLPSLAQDRRASLLGAAGFVLAVAAASQIAIPIPGTPVPLTLQPMLVVIAGMMLGPRVGAASMVAYLALGALGLPVFTPIGAPGLARLIGPTGGYLIAYPAAAFVAGSLATRLPSLAGRWVAATAGVAVLFVGGIAQLTVLTGSVERAVLLGLTPFAALDVVKAFIAALVSRPRTIRARD